MSGIKKLAGHTMWYGVSSIAARFISYLLTPLLTYSPHVKVADFGRQALLYSAIPVMSVLFTYGFETAYFRFSSRAEYSKNIFNTAYLSLIFSTIIFTLLLWSCQSSLAAFTGLTDIPQVIQITIFIIAIDTLSIIPFARLRQEERPRKYALVKVGGIFMNIFLSWFFVNYCPNHPSSFVASVYSDNTSPIIYIVFANLCQAVFTLLLLTKEISALRFKFDTRLWKEMMIYSLPLVIVGLGGIINETCDRIMLKQWIPGDITFKEEQVGIYSACYKLSLLISLFIQAFRMGAEPFFFKQSEGKDPQRTYARVMKFFVLVITLMFLAVALFLPIWSMMIGDKYRVGLNIVPILLLANMFLGIYYNLSIWFKLSNKTIAGTYITLIGTAITLVINYLFIPRFGYMASAWATFFCYGSMMVISFIWGQKAYPVPYAWKKLVAYIVIVVILFFIHKIAIHFYDRIWFSLAFGVILLLSFVRFILLVEKKEFQKLPVVGKYIK